MEMIDDWYLTWKKSRISIILLYIFYELRFLQMLQYFKYIRERSSLICINITIAQFIIQV
jgi:hypothetical protein